MKDLIPFNLEPKKSNIEKVSNNLSDLVNNGNIDPIEFAVRLEFITKCLEETKKKILDATINAVKTKTTMFDASVEVVEAGIKYDYEANNIWVDLEKQIQPLKDAQKSIENDIRMATKIGKNILDGDEIVAMPVRRESKTTIKITLGK